MKTQTDRAANRQAENSAIRLVIAFISEARIYRFLYRQPAHENPLVQKTHNESVLRHHTAARTALQGLIKRGLTPPLQDRCQALLMPYGEPETSYALNAEALRAWAEKLEQHAGAVKRKTRTRYTKVGLTQKQTEAVEQLGIHKTKTKAAAAMGISRATFDKHHNAAMRNLGRLAAKGKPKTEQYILDHRGQANVSHDHRTG